MRGIREMFEELSGHQSYGEELEQAVYTRNRKAVTATARWRIENPEKYRRLRRKCKRNWEAKNRDKVRKRKARYREQNREKFRAWWRKAQAKAQAKKRAKLRGAG